MKAIYAGSFDPITFGHVDIIRRTSTMFEDLYVGVANNPRKQHFLPIDVRKDLVIQSLKDTRVPRVMQIANNVVEIQGLLADWCKCSGVSVIIRGLRNSIDFEYEFGMAHINAGLGNVETVFIPSKGHQTHVSSSAVRELASLGADISGYVPKVVAGYLSLSKDLAEPAEDH